MFSVQRFRPKTVKSFLEFKILIKIFINSIYLFYLFTSSLYHLLFIYSIYLYHLDHWGQYFPIITMLKNFDESFGEMFILLSNN